MNPCALRRLGKREACDSEMMARFRDDSLADGRGDFSSPTWRNDPLGAIISEGWGGINRISEKHSGGIFRTNRAGSKRTIV